MVKTIDSHSTTPPALAGKEGDEWRQLALSLLIPGVFSLLLIVISFQNFLLFHSLAKLMRTDFEIEESFTAPI